MAFGLFMVIVAVVTTPHETAGKTNRTCTNYTIVWYPCGKAVCQYWVPRC